MYPELGDQIDEDTGEIIEGVINEISGVLENDYPDAQNKISYEFTTPAEAKDKDSMHAKTYQILERFSKVKVPFYRVVDARTEEEMILGESEFSEFLQENPGVFERGLMDFEEVMQTRVRAVASVGEVVLYDTIMSTDVYPIIPMYPERCLCSDF